MAGKLYKLSAREVLSAKAKDKPYRISDGGGLYLYIRKNGNKTWEFRYTKPTDSKKTFIGIGTFPDITLAEAREKARSFRKLLNDGFDPKVTIAINKQALADEQKNIFKHVAYLWMDSVSNQLTPKTITGNRRKLELYAFPKLAELPVSEITAPIVIEALRSVEAAGYLETVKRTAELISRVMTFACNHGLISANPVISVKQVFKKPLRQNLAALKPEEISELLQAVATANIHVITRYLIEFQLHTLTRPNEAAGACWDEIDYVNQLWIIPEERMKMRIEHKIPLTKQVLGILDAIRPLTGHRNFIFPSLHNPQKHTDSETVNKALGKMGFKGRTTGHGLRALASTTLNESGFAPHVIEAALAHKVANPIAAAYNHATDGWPERLVMRPERASRATLPLSMKDAYEHYKAYCLDNRRTPLGKKDFRKYAEEAGHSVSTYNGRTTFKSLTFYSRLDIRSKDELDKSLS